METFAARLASFDAVIYPQRRASGSKAAKPISWPYSRPSPTELAQAGFYYNPYETNPDNTTCFLCQRALDGWEEDDDPTTEHLKHSSDCGWAIMMDILQRSNNPAEIEDPTSDRIVEARQATFAASWPHDGKRGWVCQSDKMVEGGWYFCPSEEGDDLASCAYCNLSLDGWEPKDNPFDEHYRRSSNCAYFVFAQPPSKKTKNSRQKKSRSSKTSRLSTTSAVSETPSVDLDDGMDQSIFSESTAKPKPSKKSSKYRSKKSKKPDPEDVDNQMDIDDTDHKHEPSKSERTTKGRKRASDEANEDGQQEVNTDSPGQTDAPVKKRATKSRSSSARHRSIDPNESTLTGAEERDETVSEEKPKKDRRTTRNSSTSKDREASETALSNTTSSARISRDSEIDAALEADLKIEATDNEEQADVATNKPGSSKAKSSKKSKTVVEETMPVMAATDDDDKRHEKEHGKTEEVKHDKAELPHKRTRSKKGTGKGKATKNSKEQQDDNKENKSEPRISERNSANITRTDPEQHETFVSVEVIPKDPRRLSDKESPSRNTTKSIPNKRSSDNEGRKSTKIISGESEPQESEKSDNAGKSRARNSFQERKSREVNSDASAHEKETQEKVEGYHFREQNTYRRTSKVPPKTSERYSDLPREQHFADFIARSRVSNVSNKREEASKPANRAGTVSPLPSKSSPSLSPQSSDAENHPPSATIGKLPASRTPVLSPSKQQTVQIPLTAATPSPSKRNANVGCLQTSQPWIPVDVEEAIFGGSSDKENDDVDGELSSTKGELTSPEKRMSIDEWVFWNAKNGEDRLKRECERLVSHFEKEGGRAIRVLEGIECID